MEIRVVGHKIKNPSYTISSATYSFPSFSPSIPALPKSGNVSPSERKKGAESPGKSTDTCFGCGGTGHSVGICTSKGRTRAAMCGRRNKH
ncbi:hypothetical protein JCM1840_007435 [Sporobolomyces johnsonii]